MKTKTARKTLIFLPLLAILAVGFGAFASIPNASAVDAEVTSYEGLVAALGDNTITRVHINGDITFEDDLVFNKVVATNGKSTLNLNGHKITLNSTFEADEDTVITGNGTIESDIENPIQVTKGDLTIENGSFIGGINTYTFIATISKEQSPSAYGGDVTILDGNFDIKNIIINNYGPGKVLISGGTFKSSGEYYVSDWADSAFMTSYDGSFEIDGDNVLVESHYRMLGDDYIDPEESRGEVVCKKGRVSEAIDWRQEGDDWVEYDYNMVNICGAEETLEEDETIDGASNYKLINSKVTIPSGITLTNPSSKIIVAKDSTFTICGEYVGSDDSLVEDGGSIVRECEENEEEVVTPPTLDDVTGIIAFTVISGIGVVFSLIKAKTARR